MFNPGKFIFFLICCSSLVACSLATENQPPVAGPEPKLPTASDKVPLSKATAAAKTKKSATPSPQTTAMAGASTSGADLYARHCAKCHKRLEKSDLLPLSASRIRSSFTQYPIMTQLKVLSDAELKKISEVLRR